ncbi:hypothetical protein ACSRUE_03575 [Sorangium sp. KYC3313]|uniref:hypothetical protein n=1 Tax=Sorangium sp. KYC3313 TaxID=3449740 RepID=UPI003F887F43
MRSLAVGRLEGHCERPARHEGLIRTMKILLISGVVLLAFSLLLAWLLVAVKHLRVGSLQKVFKDPPNLLRAHIDYLFMSLFLMVFYAIRVEVPLPLCALAIAGAVMNPMLFLIMSIHPTVNRSPFSLMGLVSTLSFITTTGGFVSIGIFIAMEAS